jgi:ABC-type cobalamin/Fe3+-siderophores transport system ATPase subunit
MTVLLSILNIAKAYGPRPLFTDLALDLRAGERVGLIGPNGSGKSTLLRILAGREDPDDGTRSLRRTTRLGYLTQDDVFPEGASARDVVLAGLEEESLEEHERSTRAAATLTQVGFLDPTVAAATLSGGWRKRLALARELARRPDLLLLDEPTNHLDLPGIVWLERLLRAAPFAYVVATHDRAFLRATADEVIEINRAFPGGFFRTAGPYDDFARKRQELLPPVGELVIGAGSPEAAAGVSPIDLDDLVGDRSQKRSVVGDDHAAEGGGPQEALQPDDAGQVEVVGRLVEQQQVGPADQFAGQGQPLAPASGEDVGRLVGVGEADLRQGDDGAGLAFVLFDVFVSQGGQ